MGNQEFDVVRSSECIRIFTKSNATTTCCGFKGCSL